ncbi:MAG TPA: hypothetical protein VHA52_10520, partial [Candidatus Babeliaceae bacterium]|nr:hypothetical protein [Candidatus Babeliaceae bacterium]
HGNFMTETLDPMLETLSVTLITSYVIAVAIRLRQEKIDGKHGPNTLKTQLLKILAFLLKRNLLKRKRQELID